ncbi:MAG: sulfatase [Myxococcota bacterium]
MTGQRVLRTALGTGASLLALLCFSGCGPSERSVERLRAPDANVVFITIDTLRADHLGCYGYERDTTPHLDSLAAEGVRFEKAFSPRGLTFPAVASIMTSKYVYTHGVIGMYKTALPESHETLAEVMRELGYRTAAFNAHLAFLEETGYHQGFDEFHLFHSRDEPEMYDRASDWLAENRDTKFFMWIHSFGPHTPYEQPKPWKEKFTDPSYAGRFDGSQKQLYDVALAQESAEFSDEDKAHTIALYDGKLSWVDHHLNRVLVKLNELGLRERTLVIVSADHGEELFDHFYFFSHEASVHDGVLRVPLLMSLPGRFPAGVTIGEKVVEVIDIMPTILDVLGQVPDGAVQGQSLLPLIAGIDEDGHSYAYGSVDNDRSPLSVLTIRSPRWRYIHNPKRYGPWNVRFAEEELYDLEVDPAARQNVVEEHPKLAAVLRLELLRWAGRTAELGAPQRRVEDADLEERLRALGYVEGMRWAEEVEAAPGDP